jgi:hypothetical protein
MATELKLLDMDDIQKHLTVSLSYKTKDYPFNPATCSIADVSYSENIISISCPEVQEYINSLEKEIEETKENYKRYKEYVEGERKRIEENNKLNRY